ncbi:polymer-forming cytoskeletal protein [Erythrobacter ani]|uniref:Polymer-forming cytoskeletal protein n=1 Tax=Erythrobacter ani TaxID=2827235 RepID=A0ABS6SKB2_9SPHN|nr:polymer-forming cytoskeletal protein [Erythrobacter ani]MBV7265468.1 polymer-forming cytoskeletal protein [Erythrobacter ani]
MSLAPIGSFKRFAIVAMFGASALGAPAVSSAQDVTQAKAQASVQNTEAAEQTDMIFLSGEEVVASDNTTDDLFAAGRMVDVRGARADHLFLAGGDLTISDAQVSDIIAVGGEIRLNTANVADDIIVAGGDIVAAEDFEIGGTAVITGGNVHFEAPVGQDLRIGAAEIFVNSAVAGTARLSGDTIVLGPNARIQGDLFYRGENLTVDPASVIEGSRTQLPALESYTAEEVGAGVGAFFLYFGLSMIVSYFVIVALLVIAVPGLMRKTSAMLQSTPLKALGVGVLYALIVPVLGVVLLWTALGIPLAALLLFASLALTPIAVAVSAHFVGMAARRIVTKKEGPPETTWERIAWPLGGVLLLLAVAMIPLVGLLALLFAMLFGLGAFIRQMAGALSVSSPAPASAPATATA